MTTKVHKSVLVNVPVATAYNQWTQFEDFPHFMGGVQSVHQLSDSRLHWVAEIAGVKREWEARILEQVPDRKVAWAATEGATNAGTVTFEDLGGNQTRVNLELEYEPEGMVEKVGDALDIVEKQAEADLQRFKEFIEDEGYATGAWRGAVNPGVGLEPGAETAAASRGDSGKAGISGKAAAAAAGVAAAGAAAVAATRGGKDETSTPAKPAPTGGAKEGFDPGAPPGTPPAFPPHTATDDDEEVPPAQRAQAHIDAETGAEPGEVDPRTGRHLRDDDDEAVVPASGLTDDTDRAGGHRAMSDEDTDRDRYDDTDRR